MTPPLVHDLGSYLREQRKAAKLSVRQLSELAGISNPYLSQIERGLKKPSAEILQQIARGLEVSAESLFVRAGILDEVPATVDRPDVLVAITADPRLTDRQRRVLADVYTTFVEQSALASTTPSPVPPPEGDSHGTQEQPRREAAKGRQADGR